MWNEEVYLMQPVEHYHPTLVFEAKGQDRTVAVSLLYDTHLFLFHLDQFNIFYEFLMYLIV